MTFRFPFPRRAETSYIYLDTRRCKACWDCVQACPQGVLGKIDLRFHRHACINQAENCKGCLLCIDACSNHAIRTRENSMTTFPNKTAVPAAGLSKRMRLLVLDIALMILLAVTVHPGTHMVGGLLLMIGCSVHLAMHAHWIKAVILNGPRNITPVLRRQRRLFWGLFLSGSLCGLSGLAMILPLIFDVHAFLALHCCGTPIHVLSGLTCLGLNIYHLILHRSWFMKKPTTVSTTSR